MATARSFPLHFCGYELDVAMRELRRDGELLAVEPKVFDLLHYLLRNRDRMVPKAELLQALWPDVEVAEASLTSCVGRLRRILSDRGEIVRTYYGRGYQFTAALDPEPSRQNLELPQVATAPPFVGRAVELERLLGAFARARAGTRATVLISGDQGIGKTRLLEELRERIGDQALPLPGQCYEGEGVPAYWPWIQILRSCAAGIGITATAEALAAAGPILGFLLPELTAAAAPAATDGATGRAQLFRAAAAFLKAAALQRPLLIILEDLHWADAATLLLLRSLADELAPAAVMLVATYRSRDISAGSAAAATLTQLERSPECLHLPLDGLDADAIATLITSLAVPATAPVASLARDC
ncbi:MAG TPA: AAA family ATPase, partial [Terriglobales bacterium]|nr:AAA family ATPase [Terriglobales bacterium]